MEIRAKEAAEPLCQRPRDRIWATGDLVKSLVAQNEASIEIFSGHMWSLKMIKGEK